MFEHLAVSELCFGRVRVKLRELSGHDVLAVTRDDTGSAIRLLDRLLAPLPELDDAPADEGFRAEPLRLTVPERDRVLAEVYMQNYGDRVQSEPDCGACGTKFDTDFRLSELVAATWPTPPPNRLELDQKRALRVPTGQDELAVRQLSPDAALEALATRCSERGDAKVEVTEMSAALEREAPVLDLELAAVCPECGTNNSLRFRLQSYLLQRLLAEREQLAAHLDRLARAYGWSATEILSLPRATRLQLVQLTNEAPSSRAQ